MLYYTCISTIKTPPKQNICVIYKKTKKKFTYTLIQHQKADFGQTQFPSGNEVIQSTRCSHHNVNLIIRWHQEKKRKNDIQLKNIFQQFDLQ